jgi:hypothetical protein
LSDLSVALQASGIRTVVAFATESGGTDSKTLKLFWLMICAVSGTRCAKAQLSAALSASNTVLLDGILSRKGKRGA